jgi:hypothetical protein
VAGQSAGDATRDTHSPSTAAAASENGPPAVPGPVEEPPFGQEVQGPAVTLSFRFKPPSTRSDLADGFGPACLSDDAIRFEKGSLLCGQRGLTRFAIATQQHVGKRVSILLGSRSVTLGTLAILPGASTVLEGVRVVAAVDE